MALDELPSGSTLRALDVHRDHRGHVVELDRLSWHPDLSIVQWTMLSFGPHTLRGLHVHIEHIDNLLVTEGELLVWLVDLRAASPTPGARARCKLAGDSLSSLVIPCGVLHGLFAITGATVMIGTTHEYNPDDDLGTRFDDPMLDLEWPVRDPVLSVRDRDAPPMSEMLAQMVERGIDVVSF